jgi:P-type E1-E2 ATPase
MYIFAGRYICERLPFLVVVDGGDHVCLHSWDLKHGPYRSRCQEKQIKPFNLSTFKSIAGFGLEGTLVLNGNTEQTWIGHAEFITSHIPPSLQSQWQQALPTLIQQGHSHTLLLVGNSLFTFHFLDTLRPDIAPIIEALKTQHHLHSSMLTGDHADIAHAIAKEIHIEEVYADLRPEDKLNKVSLFSQEKGLIMIGDGINDAPALARSTVGIAMGKIGSTTAIDASDVVFLNDDLSLLSWLLYKAKSTRSIVKQNITLALIVICFATTPALLGFIPLWIAVILHEGGTVLVGLNSLRLLKT